MLEASSLGGKDNKDKVEQYYGPLVLKVKDIWFPLCNKIVNFIIQKLKSKHTSLKKYKNGAKLTEQN